MGLHMAARLTEAAVSVYWSIAGIHATNTIILRSFSRLHIFSSWRELARDGAHAVPAEPCQVRSILLRTLADHYGANAVRV